MTYKNVNISRFLLETNIMTKITLKEMIEGYLDHLNLHIQEIHELI